MIIFSSVRFLSKTITKPKFKKKTKTGSNRPVSVRFGFLGQKPVLLGFSVWLVFFRFGSVFLVWIRFGFFSFRLIKPKQNRTGRFFKNFNRFNRFFFTVWFFRLFFFCFLGLIDFPVFLLTLYHVSLCH